MMTKTDYKENRKILLTKEYNELKKQQKKTQKESLEALAKKHELSASTVRQIIFNPNYLKKPTLKVA